MKHTATIAKKNLLAARPSLAKEWYSAKNGKLTPKDITYGSNKKVWWRCRKGHEWQATVYSRTDGNGCPYCSGKAVCKDNCLQTINPDLAKEWHPTKNNKLTPKDVTPNSDKKVWWRCSKGHEWQSTVSNRNRGIGCPYCSGRYACKETCLQTVNPVLAKEWHPTKNKNLTPRDVKPYSAKKVWWRCKKGHEWPAVIASRSYGSKCPYCSIRSVRKNNRLQKIDPVLAKKRLEKSCLQTINPGLAKEWHPTKNKNLTPKDVYPSSPEKVWWQCSEGHEWRAMIRNRNRGNGCPYCSGLLACKENCLQTVNPALAKEWHPTKNKNLTPKNVKPGSSKKVWWQCSKGHEWQATINNRNKGKRCPYCIGRVVCDDNCLQTINPDLAKEWHPTKNGKLTPKNVTPNFYKKVWWKCDRGHEWQAIVSNRNRGAGCPYCSGRYACEENCLQTINPGLAKEWHPTKNKSLTPRDVTCGTNKKVWWRCSKGHEWQTKVRNRSKGTGCPYCSGRLIRKNDRLRKLNPVLVKEWHPTKNGKLAPKDVTYGSSKKVWWQCSKGHEWLATVSSRSNGHGCPYCSSKSVCDDNCLQTIKPYLAKQWHPTKNKNLTPKDVTAYSSKKVWWRCSKGHEWQAIVACRSQRNNCPYCSNRAVCKDNCLQTVNPALAREWHPTKNGKLTPKDFTPGSIKKVWWQCSKGHEWQASIAARNKRKSGSRGNGCPYCAGRIVCEDNCLQTVNPALAKEWHPTKNGKLTPKDVTCSYRQKVWWWCSKGHEWQAVIYDRNKGTGCPYCTGRAVCKDNCLQTVNSPLAKEWHPTKNKGLTPRDITRGTDRKVWWRCSKGHEWQAKVSNRTQGTNCPICARNRRKTKR